MAEETSNAVAETVAAFDDEQLAELLDFAGGRGTWAWKGPGIMTHPTAADGNSVRLHAKCVELERRGRLYRQLNRPELVVWREVVVEPEASP